jgi:intracellular multiplication protein IcmK
MVLIKQLAVASAVLACALFSQSALAQAAARPSPSASTAEPKSGLGKQSRSPDAAPTQQPMPSTKQLVEQSISDIEASQLTEAQYARVKRLFLNRERQKATPYLIPSKPVTRTLMMDLSPGIQPPPLRLTHGLPTTVVFSDMNGQPWIIDKVTLNRENFDDGHDSGGAGQGASALEPTNVMTIEPRGAAVYGSVVVRLKGLATPVIYVLASAQDEIDARVDAKVPGRNPDAVGDITIRNAPAIDTTLTQFLDGVPPKDAKRLRVTGLDNTDAWLVGDSLYLRSDAEALYPAWVSSAKSTTGKTVFRFAGLQSSVTLVDGGHAVTVFLEN